MSEAAYFCPVHHQPLECRTDGLSCSGCNQTFPIRSDGIALLDLVQNREAVEFDDQHRSYETMSEREIEGSSRLADRFLSLSNINGKPGARILDVACGKGELTIGLLLKAPHAEIYGFDHSVVSLEAMARTSEKLGCRNNVHVSAQDATTLFFEPASFDLVCGNAVLHHFLDWREFIASCAALLRRGGKIVLAEPFADGHIIPMIVFTMAAKATGMSDRELESPEMGLYHFITRNIGERIRARENKTVLGAMTDKHLFLVEDFVKLGNSLGLTASFENYENPSYYDGQVDDFLKIYRITHPAFVSKAREIYAEIKEYFGGEYATLFSHFKFVALERR